MNRGIENTEFLRGVEPENIPSLVDFPIRKILDLYPDRWGNVGEDNWMSHGRGFIWDMGFGPAKKLEALRRNRFTVGGYDINELAVQSARRRGDFFGKKGDVRFFGEGEDAIWDPLTWLEQVPALLYEAVFPSLLGESWKDALDASDLINLPGGHIFVGDFLDASKTYPQLFSRRDLLAERVWNESADRWKKRYEVNAKAFSDLELPYGSFFVAAPGPRKFEVDWSDDPELLRSLYDIRASLPEGFERFARHIDHDDFLNYMTVKLEYKLIEESYVPRRSRSTTPDKRWNVAPGIEWTFQKQDTFKYDPWRYGLNPNDPNFYEKKKLRKGRPRRSDYWEDYYGTLIPRLPTSQRPVFEEMAKLVGVQV
jgi:hypothetical protein